MQATLALSTTQRFWKLSWITELFLLLSGSFIIALLARIAIPLPFSPVPITGQTLGVLLVGASLGSWRGAVSVLIYLLEGVLGLPVFSSGLSGFAVLFGPTGGYLIGFVVCAYIVGFFAERGFDRSWKKALPIFLLGQVMIFGFGLPWLAAFVGKNQILMAGFWPFLPGAILKTVIAAAVLPTAWKTVQWVDSKNY